MRYDRNIPREEIRVCKIHGPVRYVRLKGNDSHKCTKCMNNIGTRMKQRRKQEARDLLGGKCSLCGYHKCIDALEFHHKDPSNKKFRIGWGGNRSRKVFFEEARKCILLCSNCHRELHSTERWKEMRNAAEYRKKVDIWNALPLEKKREIERSKKCYFCGGEIRTIACGPDGWETFCVSCDFLYDED